MTPMVANRPTPEQCVICDDPELPNTPEARAEREKLWARLATFNADLRAAGWVRTWTAPSGNTFTVIEKPHPAAVN